MDKVPEIVVSRNAFKSFLEESTLGGILEDVFLEIDLKIKNKYVLRNKLVDIPQVVCINSASFVKYIDNIKDGEKFIYKYVDLYDACKDMDGLSMTISPGIGEGGSTIIKGDTRTRQIHEVNDSAYAQPTFNMKNFSGSAYKTPLCRMKGDFLKGLIKVFNTLEKREVLNMNSAFIFKFRKEGKITIDIGDITSDNIADSIDVKTTETNIPEDFDCSYPYECIKNIFSQCNSDTLIDMNPELSNDPNASKWEKPIVIVCETEGKRKTYFMVAPRIEGKEEEVESIPKPKAQSTQKEKVPPKKDIPSKKQKDKQVTESSQEGDLDLL